MFVTAAAAKSHIPKLLKRKNLEVGN